MLAVVQTAAAVIVGLMAAGTVVSLSTHPHWFVRGWDFPRVQITAITATATLVVVLGQAAASSMPTWAAWMTVAAGLATTGWQLSRVGRFTAVFPRRVLSTPPAERRDIGRLRIVCSNVEQANRAHSRWLDVIRAADPDLVLAVETDARWAEALASLGADYPHRVEQQQDNCYGMTLVSRLPLRDAAVERLVQDDVPSIRCDVVTRGGAVVHLRCVHPRPPEPVRDVDSDRRDAELMVVARQVAETTGPVVVCGDLNDVAWSHTTRLFLRVSRLLDPREGRGFFNTWHARHRLIRFPLDHLFHSDDFTLREIRRLDAVGSDHFPILVDLQHTPQHDDAQEAPPKDGDDRREARALIARRRG